MKNKIMKLVMGSSVGVVILFIVLLVPILMVLDFFGVSVTDDYVKENIKYADDYKSVLNKYLSKGYGYVPLTRIVYFSTVDNKLNFDTLYKDNLDKNTNKLLPISSVCNLDKYKSLEVCIKDNIDKSNQINYDQSKPFSKPISFTSSTVTSFFMEQRVIFNTDDVHEAWDFGAPANTPVYSVCDGIAIEVSFPYSSNATDTSGGYGNHIKIVCDVNGNKYSIIYGHLFPGSATIKKGDTVRKRKRIAGVGTTGYSTGNHLHYEVREKGKTIDGMSLVSFDT